MGKDKKKKEKIIYVDDGSTISDMSEVGGKKAPKKSPKKDQYSYKGGFKDQFKTFTDAQRAMLLPMLVTLAIIAVAFLLVYFIL